MFQKFNKLNRHTKVALFVAPILTILGWAASDIWMESQAMKDKFFSLKAQSDFCDVMAKKCILESGDLKLSVYEENGKTTINSTFPLDTVTFFMVDGEEVNVYRMGMTDSPYYWYQVTNFAEKNSAQGSKQKIRIIATIKGGKYVGEFISHTVGTKLVESN
jgi:hypothetical protein